MYQALRVHQTLQRVQRTCPNVSIPTPSAVMHRTRKGDRWSGSLFRFCFAFMLISAHEDLSNSEIRK